MGLQELLKERDMSGSQLARRIGVSSAAVNSWVRGKTYPNIDKFPDIAKALGVSVNRIVKCFIKEA